MNFFEELTNYDPEVAHACGLELERQRHNIELIASENIVSKAVLLAAGGVLTNKYAEGYPGKRYYGGCQYVDMVEDIARDRAKKLFGAEHANVQPHSGANANLAVFFALLSPGDTVMGMNLSEGGHLSHGSPVNISGKYFRIVPYGVDPQTETIDYDKMRQIALECRPKMIVAGASAYSRIIDFARCRQIADEVGAYLMVDMAHIAGLVAAGLHPSPVPYAHVVTTTTHKTLRGPRGGMILCTEELAKQMDQEVVQSTFAEARKNGGLIEITDHAEDLKGADVIYGDVWASMGEEAQIPERVGLLSPFRVTMDTLKATENPDVLYLHCLPSFHDFETKMAKEWQAKGVDIREVTDEVFRSRHSVVFDEAENRMHSIKAVMVATIGA